MSEEKNKNNKVVKKVKKRKLKIGYILAFVLIILVVIFVIKLIIPTSSSKYGNRLDGIEKITFGSKEQKEIIDKLNSNEKVDKTTLEVKGKIIYITYNVIQDTSLDEARSFGNDSLSVISDEVKNFYDINYTVTKKDEEGRTETKNVDGIDQEVTVTDFPIMGYKNSKSAGIVW